ncbi:MAG: cob(I)yrinic acid a,c-diamide adenosyltransferase [Chloroflexi bacterium]|nr:cob(I)yrinic acid a,c-diamide adenosyltransferase [Chloroflexota bacterium]
MPRLTRIYTRGGDAGETSLGSGQRTPKDSPRVAAYGAVDELNAALGMALAAGLSPPLPALLPIIQNELFHLGADLSYREQDKARRPLPQIEARHMQCLEAMMDELSKGLGPLQNFILPGGAPGAAALHLARTICRRAEREVVTLARAEAVGPFVQVYLNRLSDLLFGMTGCPPSPRSRKPMSDLSGLEDLTGLARLSPAPPAASLAW